MAYLEVYQGNSRTIDLSFTDDNGIPINVSGAILYYTVKRNYSESNANAIINKVVTGNNAAAVTGFMTMTLTTGDTSQCVGDFLAGFTFIDTSTGVSTFDTDGLRILASPMGIF